MNGGFQAGTDTEYNSSCVMTQLVKVAVTLRLRAKLRLLCKVRH
jgi:hypothetical protein